MGNTVFCEVTIGNDFQLLSIYLNEKYLINFHQWCSVLWTTLECGLMVPSLDLALLLYSHLK